MANSNLSKKRRDYLLNLIEQKKKSLKERRDPKNPKPFDDELSELDKIAEDLKNDIVSNEILNQIPSEIAKEIADFQ